MLFKPHSGRAFVKRLDSSENATIAREELVNARHRAGPAAGGRYRIVLGAGAAVPDPARQGLTSRGRVGNRRDISRKAGSSARAGVVRRAEN